jgi:ribosomal RNA-processing protein 17
LVDHEEEYIDEDRYTTVTIESVAVSRDGFEKPPKAGEDNEQDEAVPPQGDNPENGESKAKEPKKKKKKFRYETKFERQLTDRKQKAKSRAKRA